MSLKALVLCSDEKIVRVLRRVLGDLEISVEHCTHSDQTVHKLTRQRFEAVIVDAEDAHSAREVLKSVRSAPCNKRAVAVAIVGGKTNIGSAFEMGAHFVLYKPLSSERAKTSFRAARALMKRERRRNFRLPIEIPVTFAGLGQPAATVDLSDGGFAVRFAKKLVSAGPLKFHFALPDQAESIEGTGEVAWQNATGQTGIRFLDLSAEVRHRLKNWLNQNAPESEKDDPPVRCRLTDLSLGGCYLELSSPFPVQTHVMLSMKMADLEVRPEGVVRVMHPEIGMGIEFTQKTSDQREQVEKFIHTLTDSHGALPDLLVEPEGLDLEAAKSSTLIASVDYVEDPLLELFNQRPQLPADAFLGELRKQRRTKNLDPAETVLEP
jgi:CheY-like chemotaxis protein